VTGKEIYPHRADLADRKFWRCEPCGAYVGCHVKTGKPLGRLANAGLRRLRIAAHEQFDKLWKVGDAETLGKRRTSMYAWLARTLGVRGDQCHIGMFDETMCRRVLQAVKERKKNGSP
jgi:hypothetical protein